MPFIGDSFPPQEKEAYFQRHLKPGQVIYLNCTFTNPPKPKYLILACIEPKLLCFPINTEIHPYIKKRPHLLQCQISISQNLHSFLDHDSFIDCKEVIELSLDDVKTQILADMGRIKGKISTEVKSAIIRTILSSSMITPRHKKWISDSFGSSSGDGQQG